ncbi:hypothetical protein SK128_000171 [Halocaridina rubra]|uniref:Uncharacterized protein n=1 Tax=Halocaridina rubra TaxID=373956 RepID=A0AAN8WZ34_HALRR
MSGSVGEAVAAAARDRATRYQSVQRDTTLGYPYQVAMPDGEERHHHCHLSPNRKSLSTSDSQAVCPDSPESQRKATAEPGLSHRTLRDNVMLLAEITREYIKSPPNKTPFDVESEGPHRSYSMGVFPVHGEMVGVQGVAHLQRHSASLDAKSNPHAIVSMASSASPSSSSWPDESSRGSPRRARKTGGSGNRGSLSFANRIGAIQFTSPKNDRGPSTSQDGGRRGSRHQGVLVSDTVLSSQEHNVPLTYGPAASALANITMVPVPCGPSSSSPAYPSESGASQGGRIGGSLGVQGDLLQALEHSSHSGCNTSADQDHPSVYSERVYAGPCQNSRVRPILKHCLMYAGKAAIGRVIMGLPHGTGACKSQEACIQTHQKRAKHARTIAVGTSRCSGG